MSAPATGRPRPLDEVPHNGDVERLLSGDLRAPEVHPASVRAATRRLTAEGLGADVIADRLGTSARNVVRHRARDRADGIA